MDVQNPGGIHLHSFWLARADDPSLELWLRVVALAFGSHRANGHSQFAAGWVAKWFHKSPSQLSTAIKTAKAKGMLGAESTSRCLVLPPGVTGGLGHPFDPCSVHGRIKKPRDEGF